MDLGEVTQVLEVSISLTIKWEQKQNLPYRSTVKLKQVNEYRVLSPMVVINSVPFQVQCFKTVGDKIVYAIWSHNYIEKHKIIHWKFFNCTKTFLPHFYFLMFQNSIIFIYSNIMGRKSNQFYFKNIFRRLVLKYTHVHTYMYTFIRIGVYMFSRLIQIFLLYLFLLW